MSTHHGMESLPAPCIVDEGIIVNQDDIRRLLSDLSHVQYVHQIGGQATSSGQGYVREIFSDRHQSTLIANQKIYLNLQSFDYLRLSKTTEGNTCFELIQDNRQLSLTPISHMAKDMDITKDMDAEAIEAVVTQVLNARFDVQLDFDSE
ncbi:MAG: hypothetical protein AAFO95_06735 [Cyanobacteria bacterium J06600_6]